MAEKSIRVRWSEMHANSKALICADLINDKWEFHERDTWDVRWHPIQSTRTRIERAERLMREACKPNRSDPASSSEVQPKARR